MTGYEGLYEVSNLGSVRSAGKRKGSRGGMLRPGLTGGASPRLCVVLYKNGARKTRLVHHLVLEAFDRLREPGEESRHGPGGPFDNRWPENLKWGTPAENQADRVRDGTSNRGERQWQAKLTAEIVTECRRRYAAGERLGQLAAEFGINPASMSQVVSGATWAWLPGAIPVDPKRHARCGTAHHAAKLTPDVIAEARERCASGEKQRDVAASYGVVQATLWKALNGRTWAHLQRPRRVTGPERGGGGGAVDRGADVLPGALRHRGGHVGKPLQLAADGAQLGGQRPYSVLRGRRADPLRLPGAVVRGGQSRRQL